jgi:hypothetical protein
VVAIVLLFYSVQDCIHSSGGLEDGVAISSKTVLLLVLLYLCSRTTLQTMSTEKKKCVGCCRSLPLCATSGRPTNGLLDTCLHRLLTHSLISFLGPSGDQASGVLSRRCVIEKCLRSLCWSFCVDRGSSVSGNLSAG